MATARKNYISVNVRVNVANLVHVKCKMWLSCTRNYDRATGNCGRSIQVLVMAQPVFFCFFSERNYFHTARTAAADLRQGEHIPKMQNNIGRKSTLRVLRQLRSKCGGGDAGCRTVPCLAAPRGARPGAG